MPTILYHFIRIVPSAKDFFMGKGCSPLFIFSDFTVSFSRQEIRSIP